MKQTLLLILCAVLMGCATTANYKAVLDSWVGGDINQYISVNGYPDNVVPLPNGNKVYQWSKSGSFTTPVYVEEGATIAYGGQTIKYGCITSLETDSTDRIINWQGKGNNCKAIKPKENGKLEIQGN